MLLLLPPPPPPPPPPLPPLTTINHELKAVSFVGTVGTVGVAVTHIILVDNISRLCTSNSPFDTSTPLNSKDYRTVKEESKETVAVEIVTDGKNDKTETND